MSLTEYLAYVKTHHPIVKQANLVLNESEAKLLKARGAFDPKFDLNYDTKNFKETNYYDKLNAAFKVPTWYGIELKGNLEENSGVYLNPESNVSEDKLYSVGLSVSLAKGLLINERMATLKQAKLYREQAAEDNKLLINEIIYNSALTYFQWLKAHQEQLVYLEFLDNAKLRLEAVKRSFELGDKPAIDTTEARIAYNNRRLNLEKATLNYKKASLELSNYLWIDNVPVEIQDSIFPDLNTVSKVDNILNTDIQENVEIVPERHPKLLSMNLKIKGLQVEKKLKKNNLLPQIDFRYNFLSNNPETINEFIPSNYKAGLSLNLPLFLRKQRADLRLVDYKLQAIEFEKQAVELSLRNKLNAAQQEAISYERQFTLSNKVISDYIIMLNGEERKFEIGESSLFLVNSREAKLIKSKLKAIEVENLLLKVKGKLFNVLAQDIYENQTFNP